MWLGVHNPPCQCRRSSLREGHSSRAFRSSVRRARSWTNRDLRGVLRSHKRDGLSPMPHDVGPLEYCLPRDHLTNAFPPEDKSNVTVDALESHRDARNTNDLELVLVTHQSGTSPFGQPRSVSVKLRTVQSSLLPLIKPTARPSS